MNNSGNYIEYEGYQVFEEQIAELMQNGHSRIEAIKRNIVMQWYEEVCDYAEIEFIQVLALMKAESLNFETAFNQLYKELQIKQNERAVNRKNSELCKMYKIHSRKVYEYAKSKNIPSHLAVPLFLYNKLENDIIAFRKKVCKNSGLDYKSIHLNAFRQEFTFTEAFRRNLLKNNPNAEIMMIVGELITFDVESSINRREIFKLEQELTKMASIKTYADLLVELKEITFDEKKLLEASSNILNDTVDITIVKKEEDIMKEVKQKQEDQKQEEKQEIKVEQPKQKVASKKTVKPTKEVSTESDLKKQKEALLKRKQQVKHSGTNPFEKQSIDAPVVLQVVEKNHLNNIKTTTREYTIPLTKLLQMQDIRPSLTVKEHSDSISAEYQAILGMKHANKDLYYSFHDIALDYGITMGEFKNELNRCKTLDETISSLKINGYKFRKSFHSKDDIPYKFKTLHEYCEEQKIDFQTFLYYYQKENKSSIEAIVRMTKEQMTRNAKENKSLKNRKMTEDYQNIDEICFVKGYNRNLFVSILNKYKLSFPESCIQYEKIYGSKYDEANRIFRFVIKTFLVEFFGMNEQYLNDDSYSEQQSFSRFVRKAIPDKTNEYLVNMIQKHIAPSVIKVWDNGIGVVFASQFQELYQKNPIMFEQNKETYLHFLLISMYEGLSTSRQVQDFIEEYQDKSRI